MADGVNIIKEKKPQSAVGKLSEGLITYYKLFHRHANICVTGSGYTYVRTYVVYFEYKDANVIL